MKRHGSHGTRRASLLAIAIVAALGGGRASADAATRDYVDVRLEVKVPNYRYLGLTSSTLRFPRPLTASERAGLRVRMVHPGPDRIVVAETAFQRRAQEVVVTVAVARRRQKAKWPDAFGVNATAQVPGGPFVWGDPGALAEGPLGRPGGSRAAAATAQADRCAGLEDPLRPSSAPFFLSGGEDVHVPAYRIRNGSRLVSNLTPAGLVLDQIVGRMCRERFESPWLQEVLASRP